MANRGGRGGFRLPGNRNRRVDSDSWGIALLGPSEKGCLLINERLGQGSFSTAQLVLNRENTTIIVRKYRDKQYGLLDVESRLEKEVRVMSTRIQERLKTHSGPAPFIAEMLYYHDLKPHDSNAWTRVSFWKYYNRGDFGDFLWRYRVERRGNGEDQPLVHTLPAAIFARFIQQMLISVQWLMDNGIFHRDLAYRNIFVHWTPANRSPDFFIGDFGCAELDDDPAEPTLEEYHHMSPAAKARYSQPADLRFNDNVGNQVNRTNWDIDVLLDSIYDGGRLAQGNGSILNSCKCSTRKLGNGPLQQHSSCPHSLKRSEVCASEALIRSWAARGFTYASARNTQLQIQVCRFLIGTNGPGLLDQTRAAGVADPTELLQLITDLNAANEIDQADRIRRVRGRPPLQSLLPFINRAMDIELTLTLAVGAATRSTWYQKWADIEEDRGPLEPRSWPSWATGLRAATQFPDDGEDGEGLWPEGQYMIINRPYRVVDLKAGAAYMDGEVRILAAEVSTRDEGGGDDDDDDDDGDGNGNGGDGDNDDGADDDGDDGGLNGGLGDRNPGDGRNWSGRGDGSRQWFWWSPPPYEFAARRRQGGGAAAGRSRGGGSPLARTPRPRASGVSSPARLPPTSPSARAAEQRRRQRRSAQRRNLS